MIEGVRLLGVHETKLNNTRVSKYEFERSRMSLVVVDVEGPLVNGYFALGTEALDDDGCPHTLEHLVFLGSEMYPYKGVLDSLANRALARGTNAWTASDHTCYTITTAGQEGFFQILPVYLDHILFPTLTESGFETEVHHINGEGEDAGVVYCEMQGRENGCEDTIERKLRTILYPDSGYRSETGGKMANLRQLKHGKVQQYHKDFYRPSNLCLIISGCVDHLKLLQIVKQFEETRVLQKWTKPSSVRPWIDSPPMKPFTTTTREVALFPDSDETVGSVHIAWRTTQYSNFLENVALHVFADYLSDSSVSLFQAEFVEIDEPYATDVSFSFWTHLENTMDLGFEGVPTPKLDEVYPKVLDVLKEHQIDMERMEMVIQRFKQQTLAAAETDAADFFAQIIIGDFLYGQRDGTMLKDSLSMMECLETLRNWTSDRWIHLCRSFMTERPHVVLVGKPSADYATQLEDDEDDRVETQIKQLGEDQLDALQEKLDQAIAANEVHIPSSILESFHVPSSTSLNYCKVEAVLTLPDSPFPVQVDFVNSAFVNVFLTVNTSSVESGLRSLLPLYLETFFALPVKTDSGLMRYEDVVKELDSLTVDYSAGVGVDGDDAFSAGTFAQCIHFAFKVVPEQYASMVQWLHRLMWDAEFAVERLAVTARKLLNDIPSQKREGMRMCSEWFKSKLYHKEHSNHTFVNVLYQSTFLTELVEELEKAPHHVVSRLEQLRAQLFQAKQMRVHVNGNVKVLSPQTHDVWRSRHSFEKSSENIPSVPFSHELRSDLGLHPSSHVFMLSMPSIESSFCLMNTTGPCRFTDPDIAQLMVLNEYLTTMEGPFWKQVRGNGLAYGTSLRLNIESGFMHFVIYRSPNALEAFKKVKEIVEAFATGTAVFEKSGLEAAKSSVIFGLIAREENPTTTAFERYLNQHFKHVPVDANQHLLAQVEHVQASDLKGAMNAFILPLFDPKTSVGCVASTPGKVNDMSVEFEKLGYDVEQISI